jgi:hypothetical protein
MGVVPDEVIKEKEAEIAKLVKEMLPRPTKLW